MGAQARSLSAPLRRIAIVGGECTGKTTLCQALAEALPGLWVPEVLREFVDRHTRAPTAGEQAAILAQQIERERQMATQASRSAAGWLACDSAPIATAIYSEIYFGDRGHYAIAAGHHCCYDFTLLADVDLPWEADGMQRDGPAMRARFHELIRAWLDERGLAYALVGGVGSTRTRNAVSALAAVQSPPR